MKIKQKAKQMDLITQQARMFLPSSWKWLEFDTIAYQWIKILI